MNPCGNSFRDNAWVEYVTGVPCRVRYFYRMRAQVRHAHAVFLPNHPRPHGSGGEGMTSCSRSRLCMLMSWMVLRSASASSGRAGSGRCLAMRPALPCCARRWLRLGGRHAPLLHRHGGGRHTHAHGCRFNQAAIPLYGYRCNHNVGWIWPDMRYTMT